jgi:hypothetical protein
VTRACGPEDWLTASDLLHTGSDCGAIQAVSQELSARNPRLTSAPPRRDAAQGVGGLLLTGDPRALKRTVLIALATGIAIAVFTLVEKTALAFLMTPPILQDG